MRLRNMLVMTAGLMAASSSVNASITDAAGDFTLGYLANSVAAYAALDVLSASLTYNTVTDIFHFETTSRADISTLPSTGAAFVW